MLELTGLELSILRWVLGRQWAREDYLPDSALKDPLGFDVLVRLSFQRPKAHRAHIDALPVLVLPIPDVDGSPLNLTHRLPMGKVSLRISDHEFKGSGVLGILCRVGKLQQQCDRRSVVKSLDLDGFRSDFSDPNRPMDLGGHRKLRRCNSSPCRRRRIIYRQRTFDERRPYRHALLALRKVRSRQQEQSHQRGRACHPSASTSYSHATLLTLTPVTRAGYSDSSHVRGFCPAPSYSPMMTFQMSSSESSISHRGIADFHGMPSTGRPTPPFLMRQKRKLSC